MGIQYYGDVYAKALYMLGRIHEEQGSPEDAKMYYEKFLTIWADADENLPEPHDARKRLARLKQGTWYGW